MSDLLFRFGLTIAGVAIPYLILVHMAADAWQARENASPYVFAGIILFMAFLGVGAWGMTDVVSSP